MNEQHLARGKRADTKKWVEGFYTEMPRPMIMYKDASCPTGWEWCEVDPATVGRCTGRRDKNKKLMFEHDIVRYTEWTGDVWIGVIRWLDDQACFYIDYPNDPDLAADCFDECRLTHIDDSYEIIGNRFDAPEEVEG